ncbi:hypothetical protein H4R35_007332 [Dimargaris xerosporica]|nr:hypothetical protein H4R35_007332 [Dimargaris xerosporica]
MSSDPSKTHGKTQEAMGNAKKNVGNVFGNESMQAKGAGQEAQGQTEHKQATTMDYMSGMANRASGAAKSSLYGMTGNKTAQAEAEAQRAKGQAQQHLNK